MMSSMEGSSGQVPKVIYIAGPSRSGSTLLGMFIGQQDNVCYVGELEHVWTRGLIENRMCGCGEPFRECKFWKAVFERAFGSMAEIDPLHMENMRQQRTTKTKWLLATSGIGDPPAHTKETYIEFMEQLILAIAATSGSRTVADSSGSGSQAFALLQGDAFSTEILHHVRDPRGVAYCLSKHKPYQLTPDGRVLWMIERGPARAALDWSMRNAGIEWLAHRMNATYSRLRYEDWVAHPEPRLPPWVKATRKDPSRIAGVLATAPHHSVSGNPVRSAASPIRLQLDDAWMSEMSSGPRFVVTLLTLPFLRRYGYPILPRASGSGG